MKMEQTEIITQEEQQVLTPVQVITPNGDNKRSSFIEANTVEGILEEIRHKHIIPVYANNEPLISLMKSSKDIREWNKNREVVKNQFAIIEHPEKSLLTVMILGYIDGKLFKPFRV